MGYFVKDEAKQLVLPSNPNFWVKIRTRYTYGEMKKFAKVSTGEEVNFELAADLFLKAALVEWNLTDENDQPVAITPESIALLEMADVAYIIEQAGGLLEAQTPEKKTNLEPPPSATSDPKAPSPEASQ